MLPTMQGKGININGDIHGDGESTMTYNKEIKETVNKPQPRPSTIFIMLYQAVKRELPDYMYMFHYENVVNHAVIVMR